MLVILGVAVCRKNKDNHFYGLAIGLIVVAGAAIIGPITGNKFKFKNMCMYLLLKHFFLIVLKIGYLTMR